MKYRPEYNNKLIGKNLRRCRQAKSLSVEQVREYLRLGSLQAIYKWEEEKEPCVKKESGLKRLVLYWKYLNDFQRDHFNDKFNDNSYNFC